MNIKKYWDKSKSSIEWCVGYRNIGKNSIINDTVTPFHIFETPKGSWGADPFLFSYYGKTYLFYEMYIKKQNKGVIACSEYTGNGFSKPNIIIKESFHLSFPCVFEHKNKIYIIPESGSQKCIYLYECIEFPAVWRRKSVLVDNVHSSDSIVFDINKEKYILASILTAGTCKAKNVVYKIDFASSVASYCYEVEGSGDNGYRNAGRLFRCNGITYRPGQNCPNNEYGKSVFLYQVINCSPKEYKEKFDSDITVKDISVINAKSEYLGLHTYSIVNGIDVIDLKYSIKNNFFKRICFMVKAFLNYIKVHFLSKIDIRDHE